MDEKKKTAKAKGAICIALLLCLISALTNHLLLTSNRTVKIHELNLAIPSGETIHVYEYRPAAASKEAPAPAVVFSHGNDSTLQSHQAWAMELSRRGFVVYALDITSAGMSSQVSDPTTVGFGLYDLVDYIYNSLEYIDKSRIGIAGFSKGGNNVIDTMNQYGFEQRENPGEYLQRVSAALIVDSRFVPMDGFPTGINVGFNAGDRSPYANNLTKVEGYLPGDLRVKPEMKEFIDTAVPGTFTKDEIEDSDIKVEIGKIYGNVEDGTARVIYNSHNVTHASAAIHPAAIRDCVDFFLRMFGAPNPIPAESNKVLLQVGSSLLGFIGLFILVPAFALVLLDTRFFASLKKKADEACEPAVEIRSLKGKVLFFVPALALSFLMPLTAVSFGQLTNNFLRMGDHAGVNGWFLNNWQNSITLWMFLNGLITLAVLVAMYYLVHKKNGVNLCRAGVSADVQGAVKTVLLAVLVFALCYILVCFAQYTLMVDFRLLDLSLPFMTWDHLLLCLRYVPFVIFFWCVNSVSMNAFNRIKGMGEKKNLALCVALNVIGIIIVVSIHYYLLFTTGAGLNNHMRWKYFFNCLLFILPAIAGTITNRLIYLKTHNTFVGPVVFGIFTTVVSTASMMLPDYIY